MTVKLNNTRLHNFVLWRCYLSNKTKKNWKIRKSQIMIRLARPQKLLTQRTVLIRNAFTFFMIFISEYFFNSVDYEVFHTIVSTATHIAIWYRFERDQNEGLMYAREQTCFVRKFLAEVLIPHFYVVFMTMPRFSKNSIPYHRCSLTPQWQRAECNLPVTIVYSVDNLYFTADKVHYAYVLATREDAVRWKILSAFLWW